MNDQTRFLTAVERRDLSTAQRLLAEQKKPALVRAWATAGLLVAAGKEDVPMLRFLLEQKADINTRDKKGQTPLMKAALYGLGEGDFADFMSQGDINQRVPLCATLTFLLEHGARINLHDRSGDTALTLVAAFAQSPCAVKLLLEHGADTAGALNAALWGQQRALLDRSTTNTEVIALLKKATAGKGAPPKK